MEAENKNTYKGVYVLISLLVVSLKIHLAKSIIMFSQFTPPPVLYIGGKWWGLSFRNFVKKRSGSDVPIIREGLVKQGRVALKKGVSLIFILTNPFQCYLSLSVWCMFVFCLFTPFVAVYLCFKEPSLIVLQHLINRYMTFKSE